MTKPDPSLRRFQKRMAAYCTVPCLLTKRRLMNAAHAVAARARSFGAETVLISMEGISGNVPNHRRLSSPYPQAQVALRCLETAFAGHYPTFLFSTREKAHWIRSVHAHRVRVKGLRMRLEAFERLEKFESMNWESLTAEIMAGSSSPMVVRAMEDDLAESGLPGVHFLDLVGIDPARRADWEAVGVSNPGLRADDLPFAQAFWIALLPGPLRRRLLKRRIRSRL